MKLARTPRPLAAPARLAAIRPVLEGTRHENAVLALLVLAMLVSFFAMGALVEDYVLYLIEHGGW